MLLASSAWPAVLSLKPPSGNSRSPPSTNELWACIAAICALSLLLSATIASYVCCDTQADSSNAASGTVAAATVRFLVINVFLVITVDLHWRLTQVAPDRRVSWPFGCRIRPPVTDETHLPTRTVDPPEPRVIYLRLIRTQG